MRKKIMELLRFAVLCFAFYVYILLYHCEMCHIFAKIPPTRIARCESRIPPIAHNKFQFIIIREYMQ